MLFRVSVLLFGVCSLALVALGGRAVLALARDVVQLAARKLDLEERTVAVVEARAKGATPPAIIPPDLFRRITKWADPSAQEAERKILLDLYFQFQDQPDPWVEVRAHLPREPQDAMSSDVFTGGGFSGIAS
jgi:hypothetical protein